MSLLIRVHDEGMTAERRFSPSGFSIGRRGSSGDCVFSGCTALADVHAEIRPKAGRLELVSRGPDNPVWVNDRPLEGSHPLMVGDWIRFAEAGPRLEVVSVPQAASSMGAEKMGGSTGYVVPRAAARNPSREGRVGKDGWRGIASLGLGLVLIGGVARYLQAPALSTPPPRPVSEGPAPMSGPRPDLPRLPEPAVVTPALPAPRAEKVLRASLHDFARTLKLARFRALLRGPHPRRWTVFATPVGAHVLVAARAARGDFPTWRYIMDTSKSSLGGEVWEGGAPGSEGARLLASFGDGSSLGPLVGDMRALPLPNPSPSVPIASPEVATPVGMLGWDGALLPVGRISRIEEDVIELKPARAPLPGSAASWLGAPVFSADGVVAFVTELRAEGGGARIARLVAAKPIVEGLPR